jgi:predicted esterase
MRTYKSIHFFMAAIAVVLWAAPACSGIYEGPNGEIYYGDYLPVELFEKGYRPKSPGPSEQSKHLETTSEQLNQNSLNQNSLNQNSHEAVEGIDFINTSNYANARLEFYYYIPAGVMGDKRLGTNALVAVPSLSGKGEHFVNAAMKKFADKENMAIISPSFVWDQKNWNSRTSYQYPGAWSGDALTEIINKVNQMHGIRISKLYLYGFSAGAQFSLRFTLLKPFMTVACAAHGSGGTVIPDYSVSAKFFVSIGEADTSRIPKAEAFISQAQSLGIDVTYRQYPGGHSQHATQIQDSLRFFREVKNGGHW